MIKNELLEAQRILTEFLADGQNIVRIEQAGKLLVTCLQQDGKVLSCGNGGSMSDAMHFAEELSGRFRNDGPAHAALALSDPSYLTCVANDYGYEHVFSRGVEALGREGDVLLAISTSGNSANVLRAAGTAGRKGMRVIGLTGKTGGALAGMCDVEIRAPQSDHADRAQELHLKVIHCLIHYVEQHLTQ